MKGVTENSVADTIAALVNDLASKKGLTRETARTSLVSIGRPAIPSLLPLLNNPSHQIRWEAAKALAEINDPAAIDGLILALLDEEFSVRWLAAEGLAALGTQVAIPLLKSLTQVKESMSVLLRDGALHILRALLTDDQGEKLRPVLTALEDIEFASKVPPAAELALKSWRR
jgi:HEAT repeat protein